MKSTFIVAGFVALAGAFGSAGLVVAAPASAACSPSFTSIPCTIAENVAAVFEINPVEGTSRDITADIAEEVEAVRMAAE